MTTAPAAVILAAGEGSRLRSDGASQPKPLVHLRGMSIAERAVVQLLRAGITRFVVSLGCEADAVRREFEGVAAQHACQIAFAQTEDWNRGNGRSALAAAPLVGTDPFLLTMVDHLLAPQLVLDLLAAPRGPNSVALAVDRDHHHVFDLPDLTKVQVSDGWVTAIGKELAEWNAGDTGLFYGAGPLFEGLARAQAAGLYSLSDGIDECIAGGGVRAVDVTGHSWLDVDTPEAFREAEARIDAGIH